MLGCMRRTRMQNEMHMMTWYEMQMMTWQNATRKQMTWQRRRITGRHLARRIRGVTTCNSKQVSYRAHSKRSHGSTHPHYTSHNNNLPKTATRHLASIKTICYRTSTRKNRHGHDVQVKHNKTWTLSYLQKSLEHTQTHSKHECNKVIWSYM